METIESYIENITADIKEEHCWSRVKHVDLLSWGVEMEMLQLELRLAHNEAIVLTEELRIAHAI